MLNEIERELERFRIHFDSWALQSEIELRLPEILPQLDTYEKDGAVWARTPRTATTTTATARKRSADGRTLLRRGRRLPRDKLERGFDRLIYVLGADHHGYVATGKPRSRACSATTPSGSRR